VSLPRVKQNWQDISEVQSNFDSSAPGAPDSTVCIQSILHSSVADKFISHWQFGMMEIRNLIQRCRIAKVAKSAVKMLSVFVNL